MNGKFLSDIVFEQDPKWRNFFENRALAQFDHRMMAYVTQSVPHISNLMLPQRLNMHQVSAIIALSSVPGKVLQDGAPASKW